MIESFPLLIFVYLNHQGRTLNDRTAAVIAEAMKCSKDKAGRELNNMVKAGLLIAEPVGTANVYWVNPDADVES